MALTAFPFDNQDTTETQYSELFRELQDSGVIDSAGGGALQVTGDGAFGLRIAAGSAILRGFMAINDATDTSQSVASPSASVRIDLVVLRLDPAANGASFAVLPGTPGGGEPAPTQTDTAIFELPLAACTVNPGDASLSNIADRRPWIGSRVGAWTTALRPASPRFGRLGLNVTTGKWEYWTGSAWANLIPATVDNATKWGGYSITVSATTPAGSPTADRIWIQPLS